MTLKRNHIPILLLSCLIFSACRNDIGTTFSKKASEQDSTIVADTLTIGTIYGAISYFDFRGEYLGYDFEMAENFGKNMQTPIKMVTANNEKELLNLLVKKEIDIIAYPFVEKKELKEKFDYVYTHEESHLVLLQHIGIKAISEITELKGRKVHVLPNSAYKERLSNLNKEIGGSIEIIETSDTLTIDSLIERVAKNEIEFTIAYENIANVYRNYYKRLDARTAIGFKQRIGWLINQNDSVLKTNLENWLADEQTIRLQSRLFGKYWDKNPYFTKSKIRIPKGAISPYDEYFKKYASQLNWDWRLLAAIAFHESGFDSAQVSRAGASGLMQLMPRTAANFGLDESNILNPEKNIDASVQYIKSLNLLFRRVENKDERVKFILASYNSGPAHVIDAMALANKYGKNPHLWFNSVESYLIKKGDPEFYNDSVVKYGRFRAAETVRYVQNTLETYEKFLRTN